ncbi:hypothetical protein JJL45_15970 [Tamlana sp. s12]|uniref:hypothetical protein n=1 Tax=Tamlana sp. s12 TaxID=1630406 RepID=UPI0007FD8013|nr:hypothetical protein [Tamlana sp. s12]OBQ57414.1 hypothetical protein VQ01_02800 [Tamlana sp. s12]QQY82383.1 hypothetical protein JJL45_15970 [Tamlana sp. s12]
MRNYKIALVTFLMFFSLCHAAETTSMNLSDFNNTERVQINQDASTTEALKSRFEAIQSTFKTQQHLFSTKQISESKYLKHLKKLRKKELKLFKAVKRHEFGADEMTDYNFWHQGVLKFPTQIEQELLQYASNQ